MARSHICLGRTYPTSALRQQLNIGKHIGRPHGAGLSAVNILYMPTIQYNVHIKNDDNWPAVNEDAEFIGNYAEWEADDWEAENEDLSPEWVDIIDKEVGRLVDNGLGYFKPGEVLKQKITIKTDLELLEEAKKIKEKQRESARITNKNLSKEKRRLMALKSWKTKKSRKHST